MKKVIVFNKIEGETPLEALEKFRARNLEYLGLSMTYAGRLDPMASGVMVVLAGEETKNKEKYLNLDKEYDFEVLFGFSTDTYDILGKPTRSCLVEKSTRQGLVDGIEKDLKNFKGKILQRYPLYSSRTVKGKPLWLSAREGEQVEIPEREVNIKSLKLIKICKIKKEKLLQNIEKRISRVHGDFRQKEILKIWQKNLKDKDCPDVLYVASFKIKCGSGTYVRCIANSLGGMLGIGALAYSIKRTKVGKYVLPHSRFWESAKRANL